MTTFILVRRGKYFAGFKDARLDYRPARARPGFLWSLKEGDAFPFVRRQDAMDFASAMRLTGKGRLSVRVWSFESGAEPDVGQPQPKPSASGDSRERPAPNIAGAA